MSVKVVQPELIQDDNYLTSENGCQMAGCSSEDSRALAKNIISNGQVRVHEYRKFGWLVIHFLNNAQYQSRICVKYHSTLMWLDFIVGINLIQTHPSSRSILNTPLIITKLFWENSGSNKLIAGSFSKFRKLTHNFCNLLKSGSVKLLEGKKPISIKLLSIQ